MGGKKFKWNEENNKKLIEIYPTSTIQELKDAFPGLKIHALNEYARRKGLKRLVCSQRKGTLRPLLEETLEAYYWAGFIAADGWVSKTGQVVVFIDVKDKNHLEKLALFLNTNISVYEEEKDFNGKYISKMVRVAVQDQKLGLEFAKKFDLKYQKTYNPPSIDILKQFDDDKLFAYIIGFIDGDGSIGNSTGYITLRIQNHASWIDVHRFILLFIQNKFKFNNGSILIDKRGYSNLGLYSKCAIFKMYNHIKLLSLQHLNRKWDKLNEQYNSHVR